jgi:hypothetical protein
MAIRYSAFMTIDGTNFTEIGSTMLNISTGTAAISVHLYVIFYVSNTVPNFLRQLMFSLSKPIMLRSVLIGVMFHHISHHFSTTSWHPTAESVPVPPLLTWSLVLETMPMQLTSDNPCSFAVRTAVCHGTIGDVSDPVNVPPIL